MTINKLKLNEDKTELIVFRERGGQTIINDVVVGDASIQHSSVVRNLGVYMDEHLNMKDHVTKICQSVNFHLRNIGRIRGLLDQSTTRLLVHSLITSRIDYCNALLYGLPKGTTDRIQKLQNKAARLITRTKLRDHITPVLKSLHWLPVEMRIKFKIACLVFKCIHGEAPQYLQSLISVYEPPRTLRSSQQIQLQRFVSTTTLSTRAFSRAAPIVWNSLSSHTRSCSSLSSFRAKLKTEFFGLVYC